MGGPNLAPQANLRGTSRHTTVIPASGHPPVARCERRMNHPGKLRFFYHVHPPARIPSERDR